MTGNLAYFTIPTRDLEKGQAFWGGLLDWQFSNEGEGYRHVTNTTPGGGLHASEGTSFNVWLRVDEINTSVARVRELGGEAAEPSQSASGWSSACVDDQGVRFNLWQAAPGFA